MRIKKIFYKKRYNDVLPYRKIVLEKLDSEYYLCREYKWNTDKNRWLPLAICSFFDGKTIHDTGIVKRHNGCTDKFFQMLIKFEKFTVMEDCEHPDSSNKELEYIEELNKDN